MDEAVDAAEVDEDAERGDRADAAGDLLADLQAAEQLVPLLAPLLVEGDLLGQDQAVRLAVDLEDLEPELAADVRLELLGDLLRGVARLLVLRPAREVDDLADRHEAADAAVDDQAALVVVDDRGVDDRARLEQLLHRAPLALEAGAAEREDDVALRRLRLEDVDQDDVADAELRLRLGVATVQLAVADHALGLGADVDQDLVLVDPDDGAFDDVAVLEALDVGVLLGEQLLHRRRLGPGGARRGDGELVLGLDVGRGRGVGHLVVDACGRLDGGLGGGRSLGCLVPVAGASTAAASATAGASGASSAGAGVSATASAATGASIASSVARAPSGAAPLQPPGPRWPRSRWSCPARGWSRGRRARRRRQSPRRSARPPGPRRRLSPPAPARSRPAARRSR